MKKIVLIAILGNIAFTSFSQQRQSSYYKVGDTIYYDNNRATYVKTNTFIIIKETNVARNSNSFKVDKYVKDTQKDSFYLESQFISNGLQILRSNGTYKSFHKNGMIASKGETVNGRKADGIWSFWYKNGKMMSEETLSKETFFNDKRAPLTLSFWTEDGHKTVDKGNGTCEFLSEEDGLLHKGSYKDGLKDGVWYAYDNKRKVFEETYKRGKLVKGISWNSKNEAFRYKNIFTQAYYRSEGNGSVKKYVSKKFKSNTIGTNGNIFVKFKITNDGTVKDVDVVRGISTEYNSEVKRVLSEMVGWTPAKNRGQSIESVYSLNLHFKD